MPKNNVPLNEYGERMARLEAKVDNVETSILSMDEKLDLVLKTKADKADVDELRSRFWKMAVASIVGLLTLLVSILSYVIAESSSGLGI